MKKLIVLSINLLAVFLILAAFKSSSTFLPNYPKNWPKPVYNFQENPLDSAVVVLGRHLFYDPILSEDYTISCSSCHLSFTAFTHVDHATSHGVHDRVGPRNSPALINLAWMKNFMWDGAINHINVQGLAPIHNPLEMNDTLPNVLAKLNASSKYNRLFQNAFGEPKATSSRLLIALAQFQLTFISANSLYDKVQRGEATFSAQQQRGYSLFQKHCNSCHTEPLFTSNQFASNGLAVDSTLFDVGKGKLTQLPQDSFQFKIPTLRNIEFSYPYMHDGRFKTLYEVLNHYSSSIDSATRPNRSLIDGLPLGPPEKTDLVAFLLILTDKEFLYNKSFQFPK